MMIAPAAAQRRGGGGTAALRQGFAKHVTEEERCGRGEGGAREQGCGCPLPPSLYIGPQGGRRPWEI